MGLPKPFSSFSLGFSGVVETIRLHHIHVHRFQTSGAQQNEHAVSNGAKLQKNSRSVNRIRLRHYTPNTQERKNSHSRGANVHALRSKNETTEPPKSQDKKWCIVPRRTVHSVVSIGKRATAREHDGTRRPVSRKGRVNKDDGARNTALLAGESNSNEIATFTPRRSTSAVHTTTNAPVGCSHSSALTPGRTRRG